MSKDTSTLVVSEDTMLSHDTETTLEHVVSIMPQLIHWLIKSGIGYNEFSTALKALFYNEAIKELDAIKQKKTDSAISLLSGLNRRDVRSFCQSYGEYQLVNQFDLQLPISVPARVIGMWINQKLPQQIPFQGDQYSFENLVKQVSSEKHPKSILLELKRLGIVIEEEDYIVLQNSSFTPDPQADESKQLFTQNISDHLSAGISNLTKNSNFLEQAIFADELSQESVEKLNQLSVDLWNLMSKAIISAAIDYCKLDENDPEANKRFRLGVYQYDE
ncbi:hypothetical protein F4U02_12120 [Acinetobacter haemolyticus]|uniref:Uncharacterized protein n=1 Tax=Acinetobacter haemolyticus CIP 64.3 = MTCC 9819 TaxID=1217659 RepID=N9GRE1_ACIHA|nr:hypothetical protein [Acinetobacter haemolyticus]ENW22030.1 hypothetical protein F927_00133 [Acinetobacter haemolyticus CIP 64.3 = MTCC 9819]EPR87685.1 hypothetical protein L313_0455 [Acinetobacter haemolyticus CIP 64.3 = MTCC 9819]MCU4388522.1 hypothetical protein [Acinetobacter haemolyticus]MQZ31726.1 hypothetical protein [Acinetobacter haemolyticus]QXZ28080.1 hypothetical protein I6L22_07435 [Acinetobacter haemolyticus]